MYVIAHMLLDESSRSRSSDGDEQSLRREYRGNFIQKLRKSLRLHCQQHNRSAGDRRTIVSAHCNAGKFPRQFATMLFMLHGGHSFAFIDQAMLHESLKQDGTHLAAAENGNFLLHFG